MAIESILYQRERNLYGLVLVKTCICSRSDYFAAKIVIVKKGRLMTRKVYICFLARASLNASNAVWKDNARSLNACGKKLNTNTFIETCLFADASSIRYGCFFLMNMSSSETEKKKDFKKLL